MKSEKELVKMTLNGDSESFNILVEKYEFYVYKIINNYINDKEATKDLTQDTFIKAYMKLFTLKHPYNFKSWISEIARNITKNYIKRKRGKEISFTDFQQPIINNIEQNYIYKEEIRNKVDNVIKAISDLSPKLRETARLVYLSNYSQKDISHMLKIPMGTVKRRLFQARKIIKTEVLTMSRKGKNITTDGLVPDIKIETIKNTSMRVPVKGYGLYFGSVLKVGDIEICRFFDYPGGVLTGTVKSKVTRKLDILGHKCYEVHISHSDMEPPVPDVLDYFEITKKGIKWVIRIQGDEKYPSLITDVDNELSPLFYDSADKSNDRIVKVVDLSIGNNNYGKCISALESWKDGSPCERIITDEGREVLHRRYVNKETAKKINMKYDELNRDNEIKICNDIYRLWYDTVLINP